MLGHAIDITDRVAAERTLRENEQALRTAQADLEARVRELYAGTGGGERAASRRDRRA